MTSSAQVPGISSGFDTASIVEQLMKIEKIPYDKLDIKKQTAELKRQAYQAVNSYLNKFKSSVSNLSSQSLWKSKAATSTNENSLTATATQYAVSGSYSLKVAQLASSAQFMTKGFANTKTAFVKQAEGEAAYKIGSMTLNSAKSRVDTSAKLETLNGGRGVYRGSVRITDASNNNAVIDLSSCDTMDDVVIALNNATGIQISASIVDGKLKVSDASGGAGKMKIQNHGTGSTATDLGIAGTAGTNGDGTIQDYILGRNVYYMSNDTALGQLNDGLGIEEGKMAFTISRGNETMTVTVDVTDVATVGDIANRVNDEIAYRISNPGQFPAASDLLSGVKFGINSAGNGFAMTGAKAGTFVQFYNDNGVTASVQSQPATQLGLDGKRYMVENDGDAISFGRILGDVNSPLLKNLSGTKGNGVGDSENGQSMELALGVDTLVSQLNYGSGVDMSTGMQIIVYEGGHNNTEVTADRHNGILFADIFDMVDFAEKIGNNPNATVEEMLTYMNKAISDYAADPTNDAAALKGFKFGIDVANQQLVVAGANAAHGYAVGGSLASSLKVLRDGNFTMVNPADTAALSELNNKVNDFYGAENITHDNDFITSTSTLGQLTNADYVDSDNPGTFDPARYNSRFEITIEGVNNGNPIEIDLTGAGFDEDTKTADFIDAVNNKIAEAMQGLDGADTAQAPKLMVDRWGTGLKWSNVDLEKGFKAEGAMADDLGFEKTWTSMAWPSRNEDGHLTSQRYAKITDGSNAPYVLADLNADSDGYLVDDTDTRILGLDGQAIKKSSAIADQDGHLIQSETYVIKDQGGNAIHVDDLYMDQNGFLTDDQGTRIKDNDGNDIYFGDDKNRIPAYINIYSDPSLHPTKNAYYKPMEVTEDTMLGYLNDGKGLSFSPASGSIEFDLGKGGKITITIAELAQALRDNGNKQLATTVDEYVGILNNLVDQKLSATPDVGFKFKYENGGLIIDEVKGADKFIISGDAGGGNVGFGAITIDKYEDGNKITFSKLTAASQEELKVSGLGDINLKVGGSDDVISLSTAGLSQENTLNDLIDHLNEQLAAKGVADVTFVINDAGTGVAVSNNSDNSITFLAGGESGTLAEDLGLVDDKHEGITVEGHGHHNSTSLGRRYVSRSTSLSSLNGGDGIVNGGLTLTDSTGQSITVDMSEAKTYGDVVDAINSFINLGIKAMINETGDGILILEAWNAGYEPSEPPKGKISITDSDGGNLAKSLGIAGEGTVDELYGVQSLRGSQKTVVDVMSTDTLESLMYRISEKGGYKTAIVNDGSATNPYRLSISSASTGEANDFVIESDLDMFGLKQTSRGKDSKILYGDPNSGSSPVMLSSSTNSNNNAILGMTLQLKQVSDTFTTINVDTDKTKVVDEVKNMVQTYNDLQGLITALDAYDEETGEPGVLFGDTNVRALMEELSDTFYAVFNPNLLTSKEAEKLYNSTGDQQTFTWMDLGISLTSKNTNADKTGTWYSEMELDTEKLDEFVSSKWDTLYEMLAGQRNAADSTLPDTVRATSYFNGKTAEGFSADNAINGDINTANWGVSNGFMAGDTINNGANEYTIYFQKDTTISRMSIYHMDSATALKDFDVEYLDSKTGKWEKLREIKNNSTSANHLGLASPTAVSAIRITAKSTNANDDTFRLLDVQVFEDTGLAGQLNQLTSRLGDVSNGWMAERTEEIDANVRDLDEQMERLQERMESKEASLWRQFTAMETALGQLQNQSSYFTSMMDSMGTNKK